ncbi:MAG: AAA-like domain protein [Pelotomaculum sp. PtaB.Bin104]|nr:MAG: AAA-like domain protein [Pelotomaculum sp. PtaB.Bin104]OPY60714.1 MAG: AAA-like domain protein [Pelotomaculum sp. PtaU1.Bin065]
MIHIKVKFLDRFKSKNNAVQTSYAPELIQLFSPDRIVEYEDHLRIDDMYCRVLVVDVLPELVCFGWFNDIVSLGGVTVSIGLHPYTKKQAEEKVGKWHTIIGADLRIAHKNEDATKIGTLETKYMFYDSLLTDISLRRNNIVCATATILITARDYGELMYKCATVKDMLGGTQALNMYDRQLEGLLHTLPTFTPIGEYHDVTVANAACLSPLLSKEFTHPSGIYFGENENGSPVFLDLFIGSPRLRGLHMFIIGMTRVGKSYTIKGITGRSMAHGISSVIIDPEGEYRGLVKELDGIIVKFKPNMEVMFNLFDIEPDEDEDSKEKYIDIAGKADDICQLISSMLEAQYGERITADERTLAERAVKEEYYAREINEDPESIYLPAGKVTEDGAYIGKSYKEMPTISSYAERLKTMGPKAERLANILEPYRRGGGLGFFDGQSIGNIYDSKLIVFDVKGLKTEFQRIYAMYVMLSWVWEKYIKRNKKRKRVVVDEAWLMMLHKDTAKFLSEISRRGAKYNTSLIVGSQSFREFTSEEGKVIMNQCDTKFFLKMQRNDAEELGKIFYLPKEVIDRIETFREGQGILKAGMESAFVNFKGFPFEEHFLRSDPEAVQVR